MKNKIKKFINSKLFVFLVTALIFSSAGVYAATYFPSNDVTYDNTESGLESTDVQGAIDELYETCTAVPSASDIITYLLSINTNELYKDENGDIRYYGKTPNNYVTFNNELWRIIGVIDGKVKIIRNESIGNYNWSSDTNNWDISDLKSYLNEDYYNSIDSTSKNMISTNETFYLGGPTNSNYAKLTAKDYYDVERSSTVYSGNPTSTKQYIGLMYPSDYGYAAGSSCLSTALFKYNSSCSYSDWLSVGNAWLQAPNASENSLATVLDINGNVNGYRNVQISYAVLPTLYLTSETKIIGGLGISSSPFILSL